MGVRISDGLPRGGLGYIGLVPAAVSIVCGLYLAIPFACLLSVCCAAMCLWLGWGLRQDGEAGEKLDIVVVPRKEDWIETEWSGRDLIFRVSTVIMVGGVTGLAISLARLFWR